MKAVVLKTFGNYENLEYTDVSDPKILNNQHIVKTRFIGINYADSHLLDNTYLSNKLPPFIPGFEASFMYKNKIYFGLTETGSYADLVSVKEDNIFELPDGVKEEEALAILCQGVTAYHLANTICRVQKDNLVLINGASSGVGILLSQICNNLGARVFALTSSEEKKDILKSLGIQNSYTDISEIKKYIKNKYGLNGFDIIFEMYGGDNFIKFFNMLNFFGNICFYGSASRKPVGKISPQEMIYMSKTISSFWLSNCIGNKKMFNDVVLKLLDMVSKKEIRVVIGDIKKISDAKKIHENIFLRKTFGKLILKNE